MSFNVAYFTTKRGWHISGIMELCWPNGLATMYTTVVKYGTTSTATENNMSRLFAVLPKLNYYESCFEDNFTAE